MAGLKGSAVEVLGSSASMSQPLRSWLVQRVMSMFQLVLGCSVDLVISIYIYTYVHIISDYIIYVQCSTAIPYVSPFQICVRGRRHQGVSPFLCPPRTCSGHDFLAPGRCHKPHGTGTFASMAHVSRGHHSWHPTNSFW